MRTLPALIFALTAMLAGTAGAQTATPEPPATAAVSGASQKVICKRSQADIGSHLGGTKVCHTESEWATIRDGDRRMMEHYDTLQNTRTGAAGGH
jgi:hypothetical protein